MLTSTKSPVVTSATSSATPPRRKPLFEISPYAISRKPDGVLGSFGGITLQKMILRKGDWRRDEELPSGTVIPGEVAVQWPIGNRLAMSNQGRIRFFMSEAEAESLAGVTAEQIEQSPAMARHDAIEDTEAASLNQPSPRAIQLAAARAAKALKAQLAQGAAALQE